VAAVLAGVIWPAHRKLAARFGNRRGAAAGVVTLGIAILMIGPLAAISAFVVNEAAAGSKFISETLRGQSAIDLLQRLPEPFRDTATAALKQLPEAQGAAVAAGWAAVSATGHFVFQSVLMLIALFVLMMQGDGFVLWLDRTLPLKPGQTHELLAEFKSVSYAIVVSTLVTAAVQTAVALVGYLIARVPYPLFFGAATFFCAMIPAIGAAAMCLLAALILLVTKHPYMALFLAIWGLAVVGLVDNVVKPLLLKGGMHISGAVVFFALLGGISAFGMMGLLIGPMVVSLFVAMLRIYDRDFGSRAAPADAEL
jgi:predicted PurR-regulated permease PerM